MTEAASAAEAASHEDAASDSASADACILIKLDRLGVPHAISHQNVLVVYSEVAA